jgi:GH15 family glucan-1,4-alpha-glucosidase
MGLKLPNDCPHWLSGVRLPSQIAKVSGPRSSASPIVPPALAEELLVSTIALRSHQDKTYPGALVASLSIPWGDSGNERGLYQLVWPGDLDETAGALLSLGAGQEAPDTMRYLIATQKLVAPQLLSSFSPHPCRQ